MFNLESYLSSGSPKDSNRKGMIFFEYPGFLCSSKTSKDWICTKTRPEQLPPLHMRILVCNSTRTR